MTMKIAGALVFLIIVSARCFASGYQGDLANAWCNASIVVLGRPQMVNAPGNSFANERGAYAMDIQRSYKGGLDGRIEFIDPYFRSTAGLHIQEGFMYVVFLQTRDDRKERPQPADEGRGEDLSGLRVLRVDDKNLAEIEAAIVTINTYEQLPPPDRKPFLLHNLVVTNTYSHAFIVRKILQEQIKESIPYFKQRLSQATDESDKLNLIAILGYFREPSVPSTLRAWLADDSFKKKAEITQIVIDLNDKSLVPEMRNLINAEDDYLAVSARCALLHLGQSDAIGLLLDMIKKSKNPIVRYNAIHSLNWNYSGDFTEEEKALIRDLVHDEDPTIARVAGFIVEKWKPVSNKAPETPPQDLRPEDPSTLKP